MPNASVPKILVVEDHTDTLEALAKLVRLGGYEVSAADGYQSALELARRGHFDLVLCDIGLWDGDGCDLFRELKALQKVEGIAVTGYGMKDDVERCMEAGFKAHLLKPYPVDTLLKSIADALDGKPVAPVGN